MNIQSLGLLSSFAAQGNSNTIVDKGNSLSFSQIFSELRGTNQISAKDMFSAAFPTNDVSVKAGNCDIASKIWERKDFPVWQYFQNDVSADILNNWKPIGAEPTGAESYMQQELKKIGFGEMVVMLPDSLQKKMEADPEYAQKIAEKLQKWKNDYDRMDNAVAASYGDDPILYQMTKSYCIQLDEDGNVKNYTVVSGGIDTQKSDDTNRTDNEASRKINEKTVITEMKNFLDKKFNVNTVVVDYSCQKTDTEAEMYDTAMLKEYNMYGGRNVVISKKALLRMKKDSAFRQKVYKSIEDIPWSSKLTGGEVKGNGVFIHEDGTGGYYLEFDWGDEEEGTEPKKVKAVYSNSSEEKSLNTQVYNEFYDIGYQADIFASLIGGYLNNKREK